MKLTPVFCLSVIMALLSLTLAAPALAHVLATDGQIGAVLHIDPADDPVAASPSSLLFEFKDKQNAFSLADCECTVQVIRAGKNVASVNLTSAGSSQTVGFASYIFPASDLYDINVVGKPTQAGHFQSFSLHYSVRVAHASDTPVSGGRVWVVLGLGLAMAGGAVAITRSFRRSRPSHQDNDNDGEVY